LAAIQYRRPHPTSGWFTKAVAKSGVVPRITPHDLRHAAASLAVSAGANVKAVQKMLGHASAAMTLDTYSDLFDDDLEAVATALDRARSRESVGKVWARSGHGAPNQPPTGLLTTRSGPTMMPLTWEVRSPSPRLRC
jgi:hypothetical protein